MTPDVSVLIPAYNCELTLPRAVRSALDQQGVNVQVVIADDASTDGTTWWSIAQTAIDKRVRVVVREENGRIANALNSAGSQALGRYIIRCDSDDWLEPGCLARMVAALDANPDVTFVYGVRKYYGRRSDFYVPEPFTREAFDYHNAAGYCYMFRREVWDAGLRWKPLGTFGGRVIDLEDWQHLLSMLNMGHKGMSMPDTMVLHYTFRWDGTWQELKDVQSEALAELKTRFPSVKAVSL